MGDTGKLPEQGQAKLIPESQLLALKGSLGAKLEKAEAALVAAQQERDTLRAREDERRLSLETEGVTEATQLAALRKQTLKERLELQQLKQSLETDKAALASAKLDAEKQGIAKELGVPPEAVAEAASKEQAELLGHRYLREHGAAPRPGTVATPGVDLGAGGGAASTRRTASQYIADGLKEMGVKN